MEKAYGDEIILSAQLQTLDNIDFGSFNTLFSPLKLIKHNDNCFLLVQKQIEQQQLCVLDLNKMTETAKDYILQYVPIDESFELVPSEKQ